MANLVTDDFLASLSLDGCGLTPFLEVATDAFEAKLGYSVRFQSVECQDVFPNGGSLFWLRVRPVIEVTAVYVLDCCGVKCLVCSSDYTVKHKRAVYSNCGNFWDLPHQVSYSGGYLPEDMPALIQLAVVREAQRLQCSGGQDVKSLKVDFVTTQYEPTYHIDRAVKATKQSLGAF